MEQILQNNILFNTGLGTKYDPTTGGLTKEGIDELTDEITTRKNLPKEVQILQADFDIYDSVTLCTPMNTIIGTTRLYIPLQYHGNCDSVICSGKYPIILLLDGTGHDDFMKAQKISSNARTIMNYLEEILDDCKKNATTKENLQYVILAKLLDLDKTEDKHLHHISSTLSCVIKIKEGNESYFLTFNWGDSIILGYNSTQGHYMLENPIQSNYGVGMGNSQDAYSTSISLCGDDSYCILLSDGMYDFYGPFNDRYKKYRDIPKFENLLNLIIVQDTRTLFKTLRLRINRLVYNDLANFDLANLDDASFGLMTNITPSYNICRKWYNIF